MIHSSEFSADWIILHKSPESSEETINLQPRRSVHQHTPDREMHSIKHHERSNRYQRGKHTSTEFTLTSP